MRNQFALDVKMSQICVCFLPGLSTTTHGGVNDTIGGVMLCSAACGQKKKNNCLLSHALCKVGSVGPI